MNRDSDLFATLYDELRRLADSQLNAAGRDLTLSATTVIHEAWLDLSSRPDLQFPDRAHFMAYAARAMRAIVIDYARKSRAQKRGGDAVQIITLSPDVVAGGVSTIDHLERLSESLDELAIHDTALAELVDLHFFCGYTFAEIAELRGVSDRTVQRDWRKARALLYRAMLDLPERAETTGGDTPPLPSTGLPPRK
jgi:RNA polymerase sigma factor (TIGR02999 family)